MVGIKTYPTPKGIHSMNVLSIIYLGKIGVKYIIISYISPTLDTLYSYVFSPDISKSLLIWKGLSTRDQYLKCQAHFQQIPLTKRSFRSAVIGRTHIHTQKAKKNQLIYFNLRGMKMHALASVFSAPWAPLGVSVFSPFCRASRTTVLVVHC